MIINAELDKRVPQTDSSPSPSLASQRRWELIRLIVSISSKRVFWMCIFPPWPKSGSFREPLRKTDLGLLVWEWGAQAIPNAHPESLKVKACLQVHKESQRVLRSMEMGLSPVLGRNVCAFRRVHIRTSWKETGLGSSCKGLSLLTSGVRWPQRERTCGGNHRKPGAEVWLVNGHAEKASPESGSIRWNSPVTRFRPKRGEGKGFLLFKRLKLYTQIRLGFLLPGYFLPNISSRDRMSGDKRE